MDRELRHATSPSRDICLCIALCIRPMQKKESSSSFLVPFLYVVPVSLFDGHTVFHQAGKTRMQRECRCIHTSHNEKDRVPFSKGCGDPARGRHKFTEMKTREKSAERIGAPKLFSVLFSFREKHIPLACSYSPPTARRVFLHWLARA